MGSVVVEHGLSLLCGTWNLPGPGIRPASSALAGGFLSAVPPVHDSSLFNFRVNLHTVFHSNCAILHSHQQCTKASISLHPNQHPKSPAWQAFLYHWATILTYRGCKSHQHDGWCASAIHNLGTETRCVPDYDIKKYLWNYLRTVQHHHWGHENFPCFLIFAHFSDSHPPSPAVSLTPVLTIQPLDLPPKGLFLMSEEIQTEGESGSDACG